MEVSAATYDEIRRKLEDVGYSHAIMDHTDDDALDMHGIGLVCGDKSVSDNASERLGCWIDPETAYPDDNLLRRIHADIEIRGRKNPDFAVSVHHRNIVLSAVANALRNSHLLTWDEWTEHCGWPKEEEEGK
jgi:hypothetical protein